MGSNRLLGIIRRERMGLRELMGGKVRLVDARKISRGKCKGYLEVKRGQALIERGFATKVFEKIQFVSIP